jgi:cold shock CspA family protein
VHGDHPRVRSAGTEAAEHQLNAALTAAAATDRVAFYSTRRGGRRLHLCSGPAVVVAQGANAALRLALRWRKARSIAPGTGDRHRRHEPFRGLTLRVLDTYARVNPLHTLIQRESVPTSPKRFQLHAITDAGFGEPLPPDPCERISPRCTAAHGDARVCAIQEVPLIGTLRLTAPFSRFGFIVPRGGGAETYVHVGQLNRSGIRVPKDGLSLSYEPTTDTNRRKGVKDVKIAK